MLLSCTVKGNARQFENDGDLILTRASAPSAAEMDRIEERAARRFRPSEPLGARRRHCIAAAIGPSGEQQQNPLHEREARVDLGHPHLGARMRVAGLS